MKDIIKLTIVAVLLIAVFSSCQIVLKPSIASANFSLAAAPADILTVVLLVTYPDGKTTQKFNLEPGQQAFEKKFVEGLGYRFEMIAVSLTGVYTSSTTVDMVGGKTQIVDLFMNYEAYPLIAINITPRSSSISADETEQFKATGTYSNQRTADITTSVSWSSSSTGVATINSGGLATAVSEGDATITAESNALSDTAQLSVLVSGSQTFDKTGAVQTFTVPGGVELLEFELWGAQGGSTVDKWNGTVAGGKGGYAKGNYQVTPGSTVYVYVGGADGYNGGGVAGTTSDCSQADGGKGGGASDIRIGGTGLSNRKIVAAGGGGAGGNRFKGCGRGAGGGGGGGYYGGGGGSGWDNSKNKPPTGGTQSGGGASGETNYSEGTNGASGSSGQGGAGGNEVGSNQSGNHIAGTGGDGGGLTGASGVSPGCSGQRESCSTSHGSFAGQSGAGGSSYIGLVTDGTTTSGQKAGDGQVIIKW